MTLKESLSYEPTELGFGTSGLRGLVSEMTDLECYINISGYLNFLTHHDGLQKAQTIYFAGDLRESTPRIMAITQFACQEYGLKVVDCGKIPTPALAYYAMKQNAPSIMVTGSHIPADRNGVKFYKRTGEVLKADEANIQSSVSKIRQAVYSQPANTAAFNSDGLIKEAPTLAPVSMAAETAYKNRFYDFFNQDMLQGKKVAVYQHSAVGRDMLVDILENFGAEVVPVHRSEKFVPIDTENVTRADKALFKEIATSHQGLLAIVSTDGDSDRPFMIDEHGQFYSGDILGCLVAEYCGAEFIATPVSSNDAIDIFAEQHNMQQVHTKIGSPYVIDTMNNTQDVEPKVAWEVNGGFLTGSKIIKNGRSLSPLPTRDAFFPMLAVLDISASGGRAVADLFKDLPSRFTASGLIDDVDLLKIKHFKEACQDNSRIHEIMTQVFKDSDLGNVQATNLTDGLRITFESGKVLHFRPSGNAPQFRVYTNANTLQMAEELVKNALAPDGYLEQLLEAL